MGQSKRGKGGGGKTGNRRGTGRILKICCLILLLYFVTVSCQRWTSLVSLERQNDAVTAELKAAKDLRAELTAKAALLEDDDYMTYLIKKRLCLLAPGEVYYSEYDDGEKKNSPRH